MRQIVSKATRNNTNVFDTSEKYRCNPLLTPGVLNLTPNFGQYTDFRNARSSPVLKITVTQPCALSEQSEFNDAIRTLKVMTCLHFDVSFP